MASLRTIGSAVLAAALTSLLLSYPVALHAQPAAARFPTTPRAVVTLEAAGGAPAIADGLVYVALASGMLVAHRLSDGQEVWRREMIVEHQPVTTGGLVIVWAGGVLHALRGVDGAPAWQVEIGPLSANLRAEAGWVIAPAAAGLIALRAADGQEVWRREGLLLSSEATGSGDRVYAPGADGRLRALDLANGQDVWVQRLGGAPGVVLAFADRLYFGAADHHFYSLNAERGTVLWPFRVGAAMRGRPASHEGLVFTVALDNLLRAHDRRHGARTWQAGIPYRALDGPLVAGGAILVPGPSAQAVMFDAASGRPLPALTFEAPLVAPPALGSDGRLAVLAVSIGSLATGWRLALFDSSWSVPLAPLTALPGEPVPLWTPAK